MGKNNSKNRWELFFSKYTTWEYKAFAIFGQTLKLSQNFNC